MSIEFIDVLTPDGEPTGRAVSRDEIHEQGLWHRTVHVWIVTPGHDILLQQRAVDKMTHPGLWDMACAGHISAGETSMGAALKELSEELGVHLAPGDLSFLFSMKSEFILHGGMYIDREIHDIYLACLDIPLFRFSIQPGEVDAIRYISFADFKVMVEREDSSLVPHFSEFKHIIAQMESLRSSHP